MKTRNRCSVCGRSIAPKEDKYEDFDGKVACTTCYKGSITSLPAHGK